MRRPLARGDRALLLSFAAAVAVSLLVNDSPLEVSLFGLVGSFAVARALAEPRWALSETGIVRPVWPGDREAISRRGGRTEARAPRR